MLREHDYVRPPAVAGMFYPLEKNELERTVSDFLKRASNDLKEVRASEPFGIISPHAGYQYSGFTAAHGYALLRGSNLKTVVLIAPSHREYFDGVSVFSGKAYSTPLGEIEVDSELRELFLLNMGAAAIESRAGHKSEHALEVQLPFLQLALGSFKILPVVMGDQKLEYSRALGNTVAKLSDARKLVVVASSDLSHYYDYDTANALDKICMDDLSRMDPDKFAVDLETRRCEACGGGPIVALMFAARARNSDKLLHLHHCNSGDTTGDKSAVVGYLSSVIG